MVSCNKGLIMSLSEHILKSKQDNMTTNMKLEKMFDLFICQFKELRELKERYYELKIEFDEKMEIFSKIEKEDKERYN